MGGVAALSGALVNGINDARGAARVFAQTEAVIKSTGGAAGLSAEQISEMAGSLSAASGQSLFGDDDIQSAQNMLLTFTNIGKDVFPQATQAMVDMATAMGTDVQGGAIQLGKALNDPIKGVAALSRVGVQFTEQQKEQIKTMVESGNVVGAQTVILKELETQFGGSAAAAAAADGGFAQFQDRLGELGESVGQQVLPALTSLMGWLNSPEVMGAIEGLVNGLVSGVVRIGEVVGTVVSTFQNSGLAGVFDLILPHLQAFGASVLTWIGEQVPLWAAQVVLWGQAFIGWVAPQIPIVLAKLGELALSVANWIILQAPIWAAQVVAWGQAFVGWVAPYIPIVLAKLGELATGVWNWIALQTPIVLEKLGAWGLQLAAWILPRIPDVLAGLGELINSIVIWVGEQLPKLLALFATWGTSLYEWIRTTAIPGLAPAFAEFSAEMGVHVDTIAAAASAGGEKIGARFNEGLALAKPGVTLVLQNIETIMFGWTATTAANIGPRAQAIGAAIVAGLMSQLQAFVSGIAQWTTALFTWTQTTGAELTLRAAQMGAQFTVAFMTALPGFVMEIGRWLVAIMGWLSELQATLIAEGAVIGQEFVTSLGEGVQSMASTANATVRAIAQGMVDEFVGMVSSFVSVGSDIAQGVIDGVLAKAASLATAAANLVTGALDAAKNAILSRSPSRRFRDEVGHSMVDGTIVGVKEKAEKLAATVKLAHVAALKEAADAVRQDKELPKAILDHAEKLAKVARLAAVETMKALAPDADAPERWAKQIAALKALVDREFTKPNASLKDLVDRDLVKPAAPVKGTLDAAGRAAAAVKLAVIGDLKAAADAVRGDKALPKAVLDHAGKLARIAKLYAAQTLKALAPDDVEKQIIDRTAKQGAALKDTIDRSLVKPLADAGAAADAAVPSIDRLAKQAAALKDAIPDGAQWDKMIAALKAGVDRTFTKPAADAAREEGTATGEARVSGEQAALEALLPVYTELLHRLRAEVFAPHFAALEFMSRASGLTAGALFREGFEAGWGGTSPSGAAAGRGGSAGGRAALPPESRPARDMGAKNVNTFNITLGPGSGRTQADDFMSALQQRGVQFT